MNPAQGAIDRDPLDNPHLGDGGRQGDPAWLPPQYRAAVALEQALGDPGHPDNTLSWHRAVAQDEAEEFPEAALALLQALGLPSTYVPQALGGEFTSSETFIALGRVLARRDMTVAVSASTLLWSVLAWIGGDPDQRRAVANWVRQGRFPCLAYSEAGHGADLAANEVTARRLPEGDYLLDGEKWPINRATRSDVVVLLARTDPSHSLRNHTLFLVDKATLPVDGVDHLPKVKTHGLRGCDISGVRFRSCPLPDSARVGQEGHGLELALKGFQLTRTFCTALSLGVGDSALRLASEFAAGRRLYGASVDQLPHAQDVLANAYVSQLMAECVAIVAARGLHGHPSQFATWSSVAKVQVTQLVDHATHQLATVLGARHYLREGHGEGMFQKFLRDGAIVSVFDGSSAVCLDSLATLLPALVRGRARGQAQPVDTQALFDLGRPLPPLAFDRLDLSGRGRDAVLESLPALLDALRNLRADAICQDATVQALRTAAEAVGDALAALDAQVLGEPGAPTGRRNSARRFAQARRYANLHTAVSALGLWLHNRASLGEFFQAGLWLQAVLERGGSSHFQCGDLEPALAVAMHAQLDRQRRERHMFSLLAWPLAEAGRVESRHPVFGE